MVKKENKKGFTLIEIMVAISIFSVVMLFTIGALIAINDANRKAQGLRALVDNLNFSVEEMSRKIRTGSQIQCEAGRTTCIAGDSPILSLYTQENENISYEFIKPEGSSWGTIVKKSPTYPPDGISIIAPEIRIYTMDFYLKEGNDEGQQPVVLLSITGEFNIEKEKLRSKFSLQTLISRRGI